MLCSEMTWEHVNSLEGEGEGDINAYNYRMSNVWYSRLHTILSHVVHAAAAAMDILYRFVYPNSYYNILSFPMGSVQ